MFRHSPEARLPVGFRGYERAATDAALAKLEERAAVLAAERTDLLRQVDELTRELDTHRRRADAVADALVTAQRVALDLKETAEADIEERRREVEDERRRLVDEVSEIRTEARQEATEIVREARIRADRLIEEVLAALHGHQHDTDAFLNETRERLTSLVHELLERIPGTAPSAPDEEPEPEPAAEPHVVAELDADEPPVADAAAA